MYDNIGGKIKSWAKVSFLVTAVIEVITGIALITTDEDPAVYGWLIMILGPIAAWVSSWLLYGFGQLIENSDIIAERKNAPNETPTETAEPISVQRSAADYAFIDITCPNCKASLTYPKWQLQSEEGVTCSICHTHISM